MSNTPLLALHQDAKAQFIEEAGWQIPAAFENAVSEHLACRESAIVVDLSHWGNLRFSGLDREEFLHRMLSNRIKELQRGEGVYNTFLTRYGKFISDLYMYKHETFIAAILAPGMADTLANEINKFIIMDQVKITNETKTSFCFGLFGPDSRKVISRAGMVVPSLNEHDHITCDNVMIAREMWTGEDGYLLAGPREAAESVWQSLLHGGANQAGVSAFESLTLEAGTPLFGKDLTSAVNPMQAGLEEKAIDFEKGCYIGQEVIAKIKYLGRVNRGIAGLRIKSEVVPEQGAGVFFNSQHIGSITRSAYCPTVGGVLAFSYLPRAQMEPGTDVRVDCRGYDVRAIVDTIPFYQRENLAT